MNILGQYCTNTLKYQRKFRFSNFQTPSESLTNRMDLIVRPPNWFECANNVSLLSLSTAVPASFMAVIVIFDALQEDKIKIDSIRLIDQIDAYKTHQLSIYSKSTYISLYGTVRREDGPNPNGTWCSTKLLSFTSSCSSSSVSLRSMDSVGFLLSFPS